MENMENLERNKSKLKMEENWHALLKLIEEYLDSLSSFKMNHNFKRSKFLAYYNIINSKYNESHRFYHNLDHIELMLDEYERYSYSENLMKDYDKICTLFSIWFHDIIYNPSKTNNEKESVNEFKKFLKYVGLNTLFLKDVSHCIMATQHINPPSAFLPSLVCDLDLYKLADSKLNKRISNNVRKEFSHLSDKEWLEGRKLFLEFMLKKDSIFSLFSFIDKFEILARNNMSKELENINGKTINYE